MRISLLDSYKRGTGHLDRIDRAGVIAEHAF